MRTKLLTMFAVLLALFCTSLEAQETTYYWYIGNGDEIAFGDIYKLAENVMSNNETLEENIDWTKAQQVTSFESLGYTTSGTKITMNKTGVNNIFILCPKAWSNKWAFWSKNNDINLTSGVLEVGEILETTFTKNNVEYDLWWFEGFSGNTAHIRATAETKYYWYAGTTDPRTMTSIDPIIPADAASYVYGWTEITETPTEIKVFKESSNWQETGLFPEVQWYIAFPAEFNLGMVGGGWTKSQTVINGVLYDIWTCRTLVDTANSQFIKLETPDYTPDPETKCYWYVGTTDPRTMTSIDPIIPADAASYVYGWTEITETPTMIDVFKESSNWEETGLFPDVQWYIACPSAYGFNTTSYLIQVGGWYVTRNAVTIGGIEYDIWKCQALTSAVVTLLAKVGEPVSKPEPEPEPDPTPGEGEGEEGGDEPTDPTPGEEEKDNENKEDDTTGVGQLTIQKSEIIYDLQGRRVLNTENLKAGIYIVNGRKLVVK